jgi:hypothetical protein
VGFVALLIGSSDEQWMGVGAKEGRAAYFWPG